MKMMLSIAVFISMVLAVAESQTPTRRCNYNQPCRQRIDTLNNMDQLLNRTEEYRCLCPPQHGQCPNDPYDWEHFSNNVIHRSLGRLDNNTRRVEMLMYCNTVRPHVNVCRHNRSIIVDSMDMYGPSASYLRNYNCRCPDGQPQLLTSRMSVGNMAINTYTCYEFVPMCWRNQKCKETYAVGAQYFCKCHFSVGYDCQSDGYWTYGVTQRLPGYCQPFGSTLVEEWAIS